MSLARALPVSVVVALLGSCGPVQFASVVLAVREPAGVDRRGEGGNDVNLFTGFDGDPDPPSVTFRGTAPEKTQALPLGDAEHTLSLSLTVGPIERPKAIGRADDVVLPAINDPSVINDTGSPSFSATQPVLLAAPNSPELIDKITPSARNGTATCDDHNGRGWVVGGFDAVGAVNAYTFDESSLEAKLAFDFERRLEGVVACDGDDQGHVVIWEPAHTSLHFDASGANDERIVAGVGTVDTAAFVGVRGNNVWVGTADGVGVVRLSTQSVVSTASLDPHPESQFVLVSETQAMRFFNGGVDVLFIDGASIVIGNGVNPGVVATDPDSNRVLTGDGKLLLASVDGDSAKLDQIRALDLHGVTPDHMLFLRQLDRVVGLSRAQGLVVVEGSAPVVTPRENMLATVGGAVILFGTTKAPATLLEGAIEDHDRGHDVLVPE